MQMAGNHLTSPRAADRLTGAFADCATLGARLSVSDEALCPRFHVDRTVLRAVCTYAGPRTQILPHSAASRHGPSTGAAEWNDIEASQIAQAGIGDVVFLKGQCWPGSSGWGAVHRSPPVSGVRRVVITLEAL